MNAPTYPPAQMYEAPRILPQPMSTRTSSMTEFMANPRAMSIVTAEAPGVAMVVKSPMIRPYLSNMSPSEFVMFGVVKQEQLDRIDARLRAEGLAQGGDR